MKKRLLAAAICLCMVIGLFPTIAMAEETTSIVVGSQTISGSKSNPVYAVTNPDDGDITVDSGLTEDDSWNIKWDGETLTLKDAYITASSQVDFTTTIFFYPVQSSIFCKNDFTIEVIGNNTITSDNKYYLAPISSERNITICGSGTLNCYNNTSGAFQRRAVYSDGDVTIKGANLTLEGADHSIEANNIFVSIPDLSDPCARPAVKVYSGSNQESASEVAGSPVTSGTINITANLSKYLRTETLITMDHKLAKYESTPATCTKDGTKAYYYCPVCGKYFEDEAATKEISDIDSWKVIPATGHNIEDGICTNCNAILGDVNNSSILDINDVTLVQLYLANTLTETNVFDELLADVTGDGDITILDATAIQAMLSNV
mgnify:FL=1